MNEKLRSPLLEHLIHERNPLHRMVLCRELEKIGLASEEVPVAPQREWDEVLEALIADGSVIAAGERVAINREKYAAPAVAKPGAAKKPRRPARTQETLF